MRVKHNKCIFFLCAATTNCPNGTTANATNFDTAISSARQPNTNSATAAATTAAATTAATATGNPTDCCEQFIGTNANTRQSANGQCERATSVNQTNW